MQYTRFASIRPEALQNNWLRAQNEQLFDVAGRSQSPYQTNVLFAAAPTIGRARTNAVSFVLRRNLYLTGNGAVPTGLFLDFGDGRGYQPAAWNVPLGTSYATAGVKRVKVKIVFGTQPPVLSTGRVAQAAAAQPASEVRESWFDFDVWSVAAVARGTSTANCAICDAELPVAPTNAGGAEHSGGTAFVIYGFGAGGVKHTQLTKPFIISEGYNLYDIAEKLRKCNNPNNDIEEFFNKIGKDFVNAQGVITGNFRTALQNAGYDIVYIDNARGTDDIVRNARLFEAVVRLVNGLKVGGTGTGERNVVMGQSMGGLVSRYGLAEMTKRPNNSDNPHTRLLVLHDSPQRGANNPVGVQSLTRSLDVPFLFGNTVADLRGDIRDVVRVLNQPATQQLSILNAFDGRSTIRANTFIPNIYEPMITFAGAGPAYDVVAVSNGSQCGRGQNTPPGVTLSQSSLALLLPVSLLSASPIGQAAGVTGELAAFGLPAYGQQATVSRVDVRLEYQLRIGYCPVCVVIPIRVRLLRESATSPPNTLPLETLPGGSTNPKQQAGSCADGFDLGSISGIYAAYFRTNLYDGDICFVPSYSALDVRTVTPATAFAKYINNTTDNPSRPNVLNYVAQENVNNAGTTFNTAHISFTPRNGEWIFNEMQRPFNGNTNAVGCSPNPECSVSAGYSITGPDVLCAGNGSTFTISGALAGMSVSWSVTGNVPTTILSATNAVSFTVASTSATGVGSVLAVLSNGCNSFTLERPVLIGKPVPTSQRTSPIGLPTTYDFTAPYIPGMVYRWYVGSSLIAGENSNVLSYYFSCNMSRTISYGLVNDCSPGGASPGVTRTGGCERTGSRAIAALYPNPATTSVDVHTENATLAAPVTVRLFDAYGRPQAEGRSTGAATVHLATDALPAGLYFVHLLRGNQVLSRQQLRIER